MYIFLCGFAHLELLRLIDLLSCLFGALHLLQYKELAWCHTITVSVGTYSHKLFENTMLALNVIVHT